MSSRTGFSSALPSCGASSTETRRERPAAAFEVAWADAAAEDPSTAPLAGAGPPPSFELLRDGRVVAARLPSATRALAALVAAAATPSPCSGEAGLVLAAALVRFCCPLELEMVLTCTRVAQDRRSGKGGREWMGWRYKEGWARD